MTSVDAVQIKNGGQNSSEAYQIEVTCRIAAHPFCAALGSSTRRSGLTLPSRSAERVIADSPCLRIHLGRAGTARWPVVRFNFVVSYALRFQAVRVPRRGANAR